MTKVFNDLSELSELGEKERKKAELLKDVIVYLEEHLTEIVGEKPLFVISILQNSGDDNCQVNTMLAGNATEDLVRMLLDRSLQQMKNGLDMKGTFDLEYGSA